jgi:hypothetical protein
MAEATSGVISDRIVLVIGAYSLATIIRMTNEGAMKRLIFLAIMFVGHCLIICGWTLNAESALTARLEGWRRVRLDRLFLSSQVDTELLTSWPEAPASTLE